MRSDRLTSPDVVSYGGPVAQRVILMASALLILSGFCVPGTARASSVVAYPLAPCYIPATSWNITAKGTDGVVVPLTCRAYEPEGGGSLANGCYYCHCAINGSTTFVVDATQTITTWSISPKAYGYNGTATVSGTKLTFTMPSTQYLEITINSKATLCLLADPFETNAPPDSGTGIYNVTAAPYDADTSGNTDTTTALQDAINDANADGGGIVYFPEGVYLSSMLTLKSNVALYFAGGSVLFANASPPSGKHQWGKGSNYLIQAANTSNIEIYGRGELDCNGSVIANQVAPADTTASGWNGHQISPIGMDTVNGVQIYGIIANDATAFTIHPGAGAANVTVQNVKVVNRYDWLWNDGMDFTDSNTGTVTHCFIRTCDDACTVKTGYFSNTAPSYDITYNDMVVDSGQGCGFCVGAETDANIYEITAENFEVIECNRGVALLHREGTGDWYNITVENSEFENIEEGTHEGTLPLHAPASRATSPYCAIEAEVYNDGGGEGPISSPILFKNLTFLTHGPTASYVWGDTSPNTISGVTFDNVVITGTHITGWDDLVVDPAPSDVSDIVFE